jgi:hypothetical protein
VPKSVLTRGRSLVARLTALAMVTSIMVIGALPASAAVVDTTDSCPVTTPSAGFTDIGAFDATTQRAIDCLAAYNITKGTSATTFSPNGEVARWQMALFLIRQAEAHEIEMPSGAHQGFTDIAGFNAETQLAINRLAQLDITKGTSATTFDPNGIVTRWQMALFLTRLVDAAGLTLPSGAPQGYTDLGGLSAEATLAINQVTQLGIAEGTGGGIFAPLANTLRWQMALFLTRTLAAGGVTPSTNLVSLSPGTAATLNAGQARTFTATFLNPNGSPYTGSIGIRILGTTAAGAPTYQTSATATAFEALTDGLPGVGGQLSTGFPGADGQVTFTIRNTTAQTVAVVAWQDQNADGGYGLGSVPNEPFAVVNTTFSAVAPGDAVSGTYTGLIVSSTIKADNTFVAAEAGTNCGNGAGNACTFRYDDNDIFQIVAAASTLAGFEGALSATDVLTITYAAAAANQSTFNITTDNIAPLTVTSPPAAPPTTVDAAQYTITGRADPGALVRVYNDPSDNLKDGELGEGIVASTTASVDGAYSVAVNLTQNAVNNFFVTQVPVGGVESAAVNVPTITEATSAAATIVSTTATNNGVAGILDPGDEIVITFSKAVIGVGTGDSVTVIDGDGSTATLTFGPNVTATLGGGGTVLTLTINAVVVSSGGTIGGIQSPTTITGVSGFTGNDGLPVNVAGSPGAARTFTH